MKTILPVVFALAFIASSFAQTNTNSAPRVVLTLSAPAAAITAPMVLTNGYLFLPGGSESVGGGGKAVFNFTVTNAGDYVITAVVNAPGEDQNSFFINVDAMPDDTMIWDMDMTDGFQERTVSWRGNGDANYDEISPKKFFLTAGAHKLFIIGREPTELKSISICLIK
ncbi:MAG TPA: hypothetical protein VFV23_06995 [Verrucomicrobiae bacterium]|nr:hypothetical protein [Verrucomicrobiae bacterium]